MPRCFIVLSGPSTAETTSGTPPRPGTQTSTSSTGAGPGSAGSDEAEQSVEAAGLEGAEPSIQGRSLRGAEPPFEAEPPVGTQQTSAPETPSGAGPPLSDEPLHEGLGIGGQGTSAKQSTGVPGGSIAEGLGASGEGARAGGGIAGTVQASVKIAVDLDMSVVQQAWVEQNPTQPPPDDLTAFTVHVLGGIESDPPGSPHLRAHPDV